MAYQLFDMLTGEGQVICTGHTKIIVADLVESGVVILGRFLVFTFFRTTFQNDRLSYPFPCKDTVESTFCSVETRADDSSLDDEIA